MESIFREIDCDDRISKKFWCKSTQINHRIIFESLVWELIDNSRLVPITLALTEENLLKYQKGKNIKQASIKWKLIEAFEEENLTGLNHVFRIGQGSRYRDFYVESSDLLDQWLRNLSLVGIMTDVTNDFHFIKEIGKGAHGQVFLAEDRETRMKYAIKICPKSRENSLHNSITSLVNEISMMRNLNHPNVVKLHKVYESETCVYLILEYISGGNLLERINKIRRYSEKKAAEIIVKLLNAVDYLHSLGIVHRDIKLENILMVSEDNDIDFKLADFGLACENDYELSKKCGTPGYTAPEIFCQNFYDNKVDIFSIGIVLYGLLTGNPAFPGRNLAEKIRNNREGKISFKGKYWQIISQGAIDMVTKLTAINPSQRLTVKEALDHPWLKFNLKHFRRVKERSRRVYFIKKSQTVSDANVLLEIEKPDVKKIYSDNDLIAIVEQL
ncbi:unnamed protein product [Blepharisma stoltei]|uniref:non-specific serine/threonine protein kinase n=1 Tax=Blepharisma stoltei TaxID=1481888 RepID=A0AAU9JY16_9CILI|nr:unnamed protein product [Blepharisma stoltei]